MRAALLGAISVAGDAPINTVAPAISGDPSKVGDGLTCSSGTWSGVAPITYSYAWYRDNGASLSHSGSFYDVAIDSNLEAGDIIYCRVTATNSAGTGQAQSNMVTITGQGPG